jgi:hypothetical protein
MLLTHSDLLSPDGLISAMHSGMWGMFGRNTGEGTAEDAPKTSAKKRRMLPSAKTIYPALNIATTQSHSGEVPTWMSSLWNT